ncbi:MAG: glycosyltransferase [Flavobacteriales bacterium]|nr:glycosyltransferase [Flavobacteriales bacterium]
MISVALISYNQKEFIAQALEGALGQVSVELEIIVGDDCSTDGTKEIVEEFAANHPNRIRVLEREQNLGMHGNWNSTISECNGEFIAILEGDDRWDDPEKLAKQMRLLKQNPSAAACFSNAKVLKDDGTYSNYNYVVEERNDLEPNHFFTLNSNPIPTCTTVFRRSFFNGFPSEYFKSPFADWILHSLLIQKGKYVYLDECTSSYRQHGSGVWSGIDKERQLLNKLKAIDIISKMVNPDFTNAIESGKRKQLDDLLYFYRERKDYWNYFLTWVNLKTS